ncbi:MAG: hypothetical protein LIP09_09125 [Bacteroidales bacterium]|nr:hypothetical protein [Bacteroidales bacterium]
MKYCIYILMTLMMVMAAGCSSSKDAGKITSAASTVRTASGVTTNSTSSRNAAALPKAVIYKMNGDYSQYVPITLSRSGKQVISYPAPSDLTANSTPLEIGDGWWLDRRGAIGNHTAFLTYTYDQYRALKQAPTSDELMNHIKSEAKVSEYKTLPITLNEALKDPSQLQQYIK